MNKGNIKKSLWHSRKKKTCISPNFRGGGGGGRICIFPNFKGKKISMSGRSDNPGTLPHDHGIDDYHTGQQVL